ncbi:MAG TPA: ATP-binding cassette domain-containing protein, partial [Acidimicrobiales bacterium]
MTDQSTAPAPDDAVGAAGASSTAPRGHAHADTASASSHLMETRDLVKVYPGPHQGFLGLGRAKVHAVSGVNIHLDRGETLGVVGESGCGKSTLGRVIMRLLTPSSGSVMLDGVDTGKLEKDDKKAFRRRLQMVFQDPYASLNPRMTVGEILAEPFLVH